MQDKEESGLTTVEQQELRELREQMEPIVESLRKEAMLVKKQSIFGSWLFVLVGLSCIFAAIFIHNFAISYGLIIAGFISSLIGCFLYGWSIGMRPRGTIWVILGSIEIILVLYKWLRAYKQKV